MQRQQGVLVLTILILFMLSGWWVLSHYSFPPKDDVPPVVSPSSVKLEHSQKGKMHSYAGTMIISDCDLFSAGVEAQSGDVVELTLLLSIADGADPCSGVSTSTPFSVSVDASKTPIVKNVLVDGSSTFFEVVEKQ